METELLLDLLNTAPVVDGEVRDELADARTAKAWLRDRAPGRVDVGLLRTTRDRLQQVVRGDADPAVLRPALDDVVLAPRLGGDGVAWELQGPKDRLVAARAVLAWDEVRTSAPGRLRPCANDECNLFLLDRSKSGNARWCSMATCGNRLKARRHQQRQRH